MSAFKVHISKDYLIFCAAHFITYDHESEPLHGHNYRVSVTVEGSTHPRDHFLFNFVTLKRIMRELVDRLDHRALLPDSNPDFQLTRDRGEVTVRVRGRRYVLPESDTLILPMPNTTAEMLAKYFVGELRQKINGVPQVTACEIEVEEVKGQSAFYREEWA